MKKVFHFLNTGNYSGAENVVTNIALLVDGYDHYYVSPDGDINAILNELGINHISIESLSIDSMKQIIVKHKPDIVHAHDFRASIFAAKNAKLIKENNGKIISHLHNNDPRMAKVGSLPLIYRLAMPKFDNILVVSKAVINEYVFEHSLGKKAIILNNIVNQKMIEKKSVELVAPSSDLIMVARLVEQKNPIRFVKLVGELANVVPNIKVIMVGDGDMREKIVNTIEKLGLTDNISMVGYVSNPYPYVKAAKISILTSSWEGFGLSALEALILGKPVVATRVGGLAGFINEVNGLLSDDDEEIVEEIIKLFSDNDYYKAKSNAALASSTRINNIEGFISTIKKVYEGI
ncbi:glycosyltransferase [Periweissella cryptocerci]|uniref:Glycosyltransferase n=1 Tax=Periweissella cryptocerci TaxID=2506420 RepID=A0A4V1AIY0_9LACO|nr:glycosyltransferase [Periweissella cryptocerci]QBO37075.1 glycosyltransferase [Periweissella cryptocerci]